MPSGGEVVPQMWTYKHTIFGGQPFRAFVWMQGHTYTNFKGPQVEGCYSAPSPGPATPR